MLINTSIRSKGNNVKTATGAVNYVLSEKDSKGIVREKRDKEGNIISPGPKIVYGDPDLIRSYDKHPKMNKTNQSTSGVIALRDTEKLNEEQEQKLIERFQQYTIPEKFRDRVDMLIVKHEDKGNTEYHFIIPHLTNDGKPFNPYPCVGRDMGQTSFQATQAVTRLLNHEFGFKQVQPGSGIKNGLSNDEQKYSGNFTIKTKKAKYAESLKNDARNNDIQNRDQLIQLIKNQGYQVTRAGPNYISIKKPDEAKATRLNGGIFAKDSSNAYKALTGYMPEKQLYKPSDVKKDRELYKCLHRIIDDRYENKQQNQWKLLNEFRQIKQEANTLDIKAGIKPEKLQEWQKSPEQFVSNILEKIDNKEIHSRQDLISHLQNNGFEVKLPEGENRNYLDITFPNKGDSLRFAGSVFMEKGDWIYKQAEQNTFSVSKQFGYVEVYDVKDIDKITTNNRNHINSTFVMSGEAKQLNNQLTQAVNQQAEKIAPQPKAQQALGPNGMEAPQPMAEGTGGLGGQAIGAGVPEAEAGVQSAMAALAQAEAKYGPSSPQAQQAKAQLGSALQRLEQAKKAEREQQEQQRKGYKSGSSNNRKMKI
ncbi:hypothetical protein [Castellaniella sp.]|uniref:hypothetical protein n=1 Tax=Castellaniella sp. TaxID=1955812 RepID=UPI003A90348E